MWISIKFKEVCWPPPGKQITNNHVNLQQQKILFSYTLHTGLTNSLFRMIFMKMHINLL